MGWSSFWLSCPVMCCIPTGDLGLGTSKLRNESSCLLRFGGKSSEPFLSVWSVIVLSLITAMQPELLAALLEFGFWRGNLQEDMDFVNCVHCCRHSEQHLACCGASYAFVESLILIGPLLDRPPTPLLSVFPLARPSQRLFFFFLHKILFHLCNILLPTLCLPSSLSPSGLSLKSPL